MQGNRLQTHAGGKNITHGSSGLNTQERGLALGVLYLEMDSTFGQMEAPSLVLEQNDSIFKGAFPIIYKYIMILIKIPASYLPEVRLINITGHMEK